MINREKVAKLLREAGKNTGDWCDSADEAFEKVDTIIGTYDSCKYSDFFNRLADLIDPTCHIKCVDTSSPFERSWEWCCSACGADLTDNYEDLDVATPSELELFYCPVCGARVVRDE